MSSLDQEWIILAKLGDHTAIGQLMAKYKHLVRNVVRKYFLVGGDQEDLMQEGMIGLYDAILSYDIEKNDHFEPYAYLLIERHVLNAIKKATSYKNSPLNDGARLDHQGGLGVEEGTIPLAMDSLTPEEILVRQEQERLFHEAIETKLTTLEKDIVALYLKGFSYQMIAEKLSISAKSVDNGLSRIKAKLSYLKDKE